MPPSSRIEIEQVFTVPALPAVAVLPLVDVAVPEAHRACVPPTPPQRPPPSSGVRPRRFIQPAALSNRQDRVAAHQGRRPSARATPPHASDTRADDGLELT